MRTLVLTRAFYSDQNTLGMLQIRDVGHNPIYTLENPWVDNHKNISCVPTGEYICNPHNGYKYKNVWRLKDVPNREDILIHWGNWASDTEGCIIVGLGAGDLHGNPAVLHSRDAIELLRGLLGKKSFRLIIK